MRSGRGFGTQQACSLGRFGVLRGGAETGEIGGAMWKRSVIARSDRSCRPRTERGGALDHRLLGRS